MKVAMAVTKPIMIVTLSPFEDMAPNKMMIIYRYKEKNKEKIN